MLLSRLLLLGLFLGTLGLQLHASIPSPFELRLDFSVSPDTTTCPDGFLIDLGPDIVIIYGEASIFISSVIGH